jgi:hypothetical protein
VRLCCSKKDLLPTLCDSCVFIDSRASTVFAIAWSLIQFRMCVPVKNLFPVLTRFLSWSIPWSYLRIELRYLLLAFRHIKNLGPRLHGPQTLNQHNKYYVCSRIFRSPIQHIKNLVPPLGPRSLRRLSQTWCLLSIRCDLQFNIK